MTLCARRISWICAVAFCMQVLAFESSRSALAHEFKPLPDAMPAGSGTLIRPDGLVVTAAHVVSSCLERLRAPAGHSINARWTLAPRNVRCSDLRLDVYAGAQEPERVDHATLIAVTSTPPPARAENGLAHLAELVLLQAPIERSNAGVALSDEEPRPGTGIWVQGTLSLGAASRNPAECHLRQSVLARHLDQAEALETLADNLRMDEQPNGSPEWIESSGLESEPPQCFREPGSARDVARSVLRDSATEFEEALAKTDPNTFSQACRRVLQSYSVQLRYLAAGSPESLKSEVASRARNQRAIAEFARLFVGDQSRGKADDKAVWRAAGRITIVCGDFLFSDAPSGPGMSGGVVFDTEGKVLGVIVGGRRSPKPGWPANTVAIRLEGILFGFEGA